MLDLPLVFLLKSRKLVKYIVMRQCGASAMPKCSVFIATSLDGFIARKNGNLDWLPGSDGVPGQSGEDYGYKSFFESIDALILGRKTYELASIRSGVAPHGKECLRKGSRYPKHATAHFPKTSKVPR